MTLQEFVPALILALATATSSLAGAGVGHETGLAARFPGDIGIAEDESVVAAFDFEDDSWRIALHSHSPGDTVSTVVANTSLAAFKAFRGRAVAIKVAQGEHYGGSLEYFFSTHGTRKEPESIYFRYYLRFGDDWDGRHGKLPGFGGTYDRAGWGGKPSDGYNGWSARGCFSCPVNDRVQIGTYCYHADRKSQYGAVWKWRTQDRGLLEKNRWYCIEQYLRLNSPGEPNGVIRAWVDGLPAFEKSDIRFRYTSDLRIEKIWFNIYHGGKESAQSDDHVFFDNVVIAHKYIGPLNEPSR
jgi:hypothetical protein